MEIPFKRANILLPKKNVDMSKWSVVACDQYTSEPEYWKEVAEIVGKEPSTLNLVLPEVYLEENDVSERIKKINENMKNLLKDNFFEEHKESLIYVERTQADGTVRKGIVGVIDLEEYSYEKGSQSLVRTTEGTILERIPPRIRVRENAELELPHIMLLIDDRKKEIIEDITNKVEENDKVYDFDLMKKGGHIKGYKLNDRIMQEVMNKLEKLTDKKYFEEKYEVKDKGVLLFSVGDGNHSLATAKTWYENLKKTLPKEEYENHPARYALVEVVNIHSDALKFEPIHRVLFDVNVENVLEQLNKYYEISEKSDGGQKVKYICKGKEGEFYIKNPKANIPVGSMQIFIDEYLKENGGKIDYIHGDDITRELASKEGNIGFIFEGIEKEELFKTIILDGALPRKTFSMGHSYDKRYYLESRKIR